VVLQRSQCAVVVRQFRLTTQQRLVLVYFLLHLRGNEITHNSWHLNAHKEQITNNSNNDDNDLGLMISDISGEARQTTFSSNVSQ